VLFLRSESELANEPPKRRQHLLPFGALPSGEFPTGVPGDSAADVEERPIRWTGTRSCTSADKLEIYPCMSLADQRDIASHTDTP
jgi:hypothetical protein